jgi:GNAT superfamily N-acetyltransferase
VVYRDDADRLIGVGVLSNPVPSCAARQNALMLAATRYDPGKIRWLNGNLRTISRVIVHPQFRGIGVAGELVRALCRESGVRYVEAIARMGTVVPFFERGGMTRHECGAGKPAYYLWDRKAQNN